MFHFVESGLTLSRGVPSSRSSIWRGVISNPIVSLPAGNSIIPKPLLSIKEDSLHELIANPIREKRDVEYKSESYGNKHAQRREFLADVSSFANTIGGDLLIGVQEKNGLPVAFPGVVLENVDGEIQRLQQMLLYGIEPRLSGVDIHAIELSTAKYVLIVRTRRSWNGPHRVILEGHDKFYARELKWQTPDERGRASPSLHPQ